MIAIDICNTIADVNGMLRDRFGLGLAGYPHPFPDGFWASPEGMRVFQDAKPMGDAAQVITGLAKSLGGIVYVTARPAEAELVTRGWLKKHGFPRGKVIFAPKSQKAVIYRALEPCLIAEDDPEVIVGLDGCGAAIFVPRWPYNKHLRLDRVVFVDRWDTNSGEMGGAGLWV